MIKPTGTYVLIKATIVEKVSKGGIVLPNDLTAKEQTVERTGEVVAIGPCAYVGWAGCSDEDPAGDWGIKIGDSIEHKRYDGLDSIESTKEIIYRYVKDTDILGVIHD